MGALLAVGLSALALAACGGSDSEAGSGSSRGSSSSSNEQDAARVRLTQCLRENGVDVPDNPGRGADIDRDKLQEALEGPCKELQDVAFGDITEEDRQEMQDSFQQFAQCMRENGVDVPDIDTSGDGPPAGGGQLNQDDPDVQAAMEKCQDELPQGGPGGGRR